MWRNDREMKWNPLTPNANFQFGILGIHCLSLHICCANVPCHHRSNASGRHIEKGVGTCIYGSRPFPYGLIVQMDMPTFFLCDRWWIHCSCNIPMGNKTNAHQSHAVTHMCDSCCSSQLNAYGFYGLFQFPLLGIMPMHSIISFIPPLSSP